MVRHPQTFGHIRDCIPPNAFLHYQHLLALTALSIAITIGANVYITVL